MNLHNNNPHFSFSSPISSSGQDSRFIAPLLPFVGGLLVGGLYSSTKRPPYYPSPYYPYTPYPPFTPYPPYPPYPGEQTNIYYPPYGPGPYHDSYYMGRPAHSSPMPYGGGEQLAHYESFGTTSGMPDKMY